MATSRTAAACVIWVLLGAGRLAAQRPDVNKATLGRALRRRLTEEENAASLQRPCLTRPERLRLRHWLEQRRARPEHNGGDAQPVFVEEVARHQAGRKVGAAED